MQLRYWGLAAFLLTGVAHATPPNGGFDDCLVSLQPTPVPSTLRDFAFFKVADSAGVALLGGSLREVGGKLYYYPWYAEPFLIASGSPPQLAPGVLLVGRTLVLTYVLPERERR